MSRNLFVLLPESTDLNYAQSAAIDVLDAFDKNAYIPGRTTVDPPTLEAIRTREEENNIPRYSTMNIDWHKNLVIDGVVQRYISGQNFVANRDPDGRRQVEFDGMIPNPNGKYDSDYLEWDDLLVLGSTTEDGETPNVARIAHINWGKTKEPDVLVDATGDEAEWLEIPPKKKGDLFGRLGRRKLRSIVVTATIGDE
jgi:hypothetical protein